MVFYAHYQKHLPCRISTMWFFKNAALFRNFWAPYIGSLHFVTRWGGIKVDVPRRHDLHIIHEVIGRKVYDVSMLKNPKVILDIGAHVGTFSLLALKLFPDVTVYSYEPSSVNFKYLKKNIEQNGFSERCKLYNVAVAGAAGERPLFLSRQGDSGHNRLLKRDLPQGTEMVKCVTLDSILSQFREVDFLKIDIEGSEGEVLQACTQLHKVKHAAVEGAQENIPEEIPYSYDEQTGIAVLKLLP